MLVFTEQQPGEPLEQECKVWLLLAPGIIAVSSALRQLAYRTVSSVIPQSWSV